jgi:hypothetical protein
MQLWPTKSQRPPQWASRRGVPGKSADEKVSDRRYQPRGYGARVSPRGWHGYGVAASALAVIAVGAILAGWVTAILSNQEQNETIVKVGYPSGKILWSYGHPRHPGTARGYLHEPDDAFLLRNGQISVADAVNCRVLVLNQNGTVAHQIGTNGVCVHHPPTSMGSPNGDTPLADGNLLISEINGSWVSEYTLRGKLVWTTHCL